MKKLVYERPDGKITIVNPVEPMLAGETEDQYLERIRALAEAGIPELKTFVHKGRVDNVPNNRKFREAWRAVDGKIEEDATEVVKIKWEDVRALRDKLLAESDIQRKISEDTADGKAAEWKQYQQDLRDITKQPDPDAVVWPVAPTKAETDESKRTK